MYKETIAMLKKIIISITLLSFCFYQLGCYTTRGVSQKEFMEDQYQWIEKVVTSDGTVYEFLSMRPIGNGDYAKSGGKVVGDSVKGTLLDGTHKSIPLSDVDMFYVLKFNPAKTVLSVIGVSALVAVGVVLIIAATKESCPFIYSFDGQQYRFDGEPYGGSVCEGLERTDYCRLDYLRPVNGEYKLMLTNEVDETQYTDEFKLCVFDHPAGTRVVPDAAGRFYTIRDPLSPVRATDKKGRDIQRWISRTDDLFWESGIHPHDTVDPGSLRDTLTLTFPKPAANASGKFVVSASNTLWGSQMLKRYLNLWGDQVDTWYHNLTNADTLALYGAWQEREEVFRMQVKVWANNQWVTRGEILGGGPFMTEERVVPLSLDGVSGDSVKICLCPPAGFWQLNSFAMDYSSDESYDRRELAASSMVGHDNTDLRRILDSTDHRYYAMPGTGQTAMIVFPAPLPITGHERTVYAKVSGYYDIHLKRSGPMQLQTRQRIAAEPGYFTKFSLQEYYRWRAEQMATVDGSH